MQLQYFTRNTILLYLEGLYLGIFYYIIMILSYIKKFYLCKIWLTAIKSFGTDSLAVIQNAYTVRYFTGKHINLLFGIHLTTLRLGSVLALNVQEHIYIKFGKLFNIHGHYLLGVTLHVCNFLSNTIEIYFAILKPVYLYIYIILFI